MALLVVLAALFAASTSPASTPKLHGNNFYANCRFSHTNNDDPIVYPGQPGKSHPHTFLRQRVDRRELDARKPPPRRDDLQAERGQGGVLGADAVPGQSRDQAR